MERLGLVAAIALGLLPVSALGQATINVPKDQPTIQAAIGAASDGDTVLVAPGTYYENIDFLGKSITVTSSGGAAQTIIDGGSTGPTVTFQLAETRNAVLSGMTIQNGGGFGTNTSVVGIAGVLVSASSPTILNNTIKNNQCWDIEILVGGPLIEGNEISTTTTPSGGCGAGSGAGIFVGGNQIGNVSSFNGAAVIVGNTIENISIPASTGPAGGLYSADNNGGAAIAVLAGGPVIEGNILRNNSAPTGNGGAINVAGGVGVTIAQNLIYGNSAGCGGGAISYTDGDAGVNLAPGGLVVIANNTIVDNTGGGSTQYLTCGESSQIYGSLFGQSSQAVQIVNNVIASTTMDAPAVNCPASSYLATPDEIDQSVFDHNVLYNAGGSFFGPTCVDVSAKYGNTTGAPQFVNAAGGDYHLLPGSPGIDTGNNSVLQIFYGLSGTALATDFDGNARVKDATGVGYPVIDMGAYESPGKVDGTPTTVLFTASIYSGTPGEPLALSATLGSALGLPTGNATFFLDGQQIGVAAINANGFADLFTVVPSAGIHSLYAMYAGDGSFLPARSVIILIEAVSPPVSSGYATTLNLYSNVVQQTYGQDITLTAIVSSADPNAAFFPSPITLTLDQGGAFGSLTPDKSGTARYTTKTLPVGHDLITATYAGDATHQAATSSVTVDINGFSTYIGVSCSPLTIQIGQTSTISVTVSSPAGTPTGPVNFSDDGIPLAEVELINGSASLTYLGQSVGLHYIQAYYVGMDGYARSAPRPCYTPQPPPPPPPPPHPPDIVVVGLPSTSVLSVNPTSGPFEATTNMTATVSSANPATNPPGVGTPTGAVTFFDGTNMLGTANLVAGVAKFSTIALPAGTNPVTCMYGGDSVYSPSGCNTVSVSTSPAQPTLTLTASANDIPALTPVEFTVQLVASGQPAPKGNVVVLSIAGQNFPLTLDANGTAGHVVSTLTPGSYPVTASLSPTANLFGASASLTETVVASSSTTIVIAAPSPGYVGQPITISAMVTAADTLVPEGTTVTFYDGAATLGTGTLDQTRTATLTTSTLAVGTHPLTASYPGSGAFLGSTSAVFNEVVLASSFTIALSPSTITLPGDQTATVAIQLTSIGGFAGPLTLSYGTLPVNASASILPATVTLPAGGTGSATLTLNTATPTAVAKSLSRPPRGAELPTVLAAMLVLFFPWRSRRLRSRFSKLRLTGLFAWLLFSAVMLQMLTGCGDSFYTLPGVAPGTYEIPITATDINQNMHTAVLTLVVPAQLQ